MNHRNKLIFTVVTAILAPEMTYTPPLIGSDTILNKKDYGHQETSEGFHASIVRDDNQTNFRSVTELHHVRRTIFMRSVKCEEDIPPRTSH